MRDVPISQDGQHGFAALQDMLSTLTVQVHHRGQAQTIGIPLLADEGIVFHALNQGDFSMVIGPKPPGVSPPASDGRRVKQLLKKRQLSRGQRARRGQSINHRKLVS